MNIVITSQTLSLVYAGLAILFVGIFYLFRQLFLRNKYAKETIDHVWIQIIPIAGKEKNYMIQVENVGGVSRVKIPDVKGKINEKSPTHILGNEGEFQADYPANKSHFVQTTATKLIYYEGDAEPLSNVGDRPIISGQLISNMADGIATASADAMRKSQDESGVKLNKNNLILYTMVIAGLGAIAAIVAVVLIIKETKIIEELAPLIKHALGIVQ